MLERQINQERPTILPISPFKKGNFVCAKLLDMGLLKLSLFFIIFTSLSSCKDGAQETSNHEVNRYTPFPYIGQHDIGVIVENGVEKMDTIYHQVPPFVLLNQDSVLITNEDVQGKVHVANFFFTSCPAICPAMIAQMKRLQEMTAEVDELLFLSHTIDPERDTLAKLRSYIEERDINTTNWHFLRGEREYVHDLGKTGYMVNAMEDEAADGGFLHSEHFVLVDREGHVRGLYVGTETEQVDQLAKDIKTLIENEY